MTQNEIIIKLPKPHENQRKVLGEAKRFNVLCNGRRWGKTTLSQRLIKPAITDAWRIGFWTPTYKDLAEVWKEIKFRLYPIIERKDEQLKQLNLYGGGVIDMWSMDDPNSGRGRKYHRAIIDEFAKARKHGKEAWQETIRPTLTDFKGDAWFLSTPKGVNSYFYELFKMEQEHSNWKSWQMPTLTNPYIDPGEIEEARNQLDPVTFKQEYEAQFVSMSDKPFMYCFENRHISKTIELNNKDTVYLSFDFNVDPITCTAWQLGKDFIHGLYEFRLRNSNVYELCEVIKGTLPSCHFIITGDASGLSRHVTNKGNINNYTIILQELGLGIGQLKVPKSNPPINESRTLCNSVFSKHPNVFLHERMKYLIEDNRFVQVKEDGSIDKTSDAHAGHLLDTERYIMNSFKHDFISRKR